MPKECPSAEPLRPAVELSSRPILGYRRSPPENFRERRCDNEGAESPMTILRLSRAHGGSHGGEPNPGSARSIGLTVRVTSVLPSGAVVISPGEEIQSGVDSSPPGTTVIQ